jgi:hypothetical protein
MDKRTEQQAVKDCLATPGARIIARKLRQAAKGTLKRYDKCRPDDLVFHQMFRRVVNEELPRIIEGVVNPPQEEKRFDWRRLLRLR